MNKVLKILAAAVVTLATFVAAAPPAAAAEPEGQHFRAGEFNVDAFGVGSIRNLNGPTEFGAGLGASYFVTRGLGLGAYAISYDRDGAAVDQVEGKLIFRAPLWDRLAPYGWCAGNYDFERRAWSAGAGGGLEFRLLRRVGLYAEAGPMLSTDGQVAQLRALAGVRVNF